MHDPISSGAFERVTPRLPVADLQRTITFYRDRLGLTVDVLWPDESPSFAILARDGVSLGFFLRGDRPPEALGASELYIQVSDADAVHAALRERVPIEWGPEVYSYGCREFAVRDPDGYLVIFTEPTDEPPTTAEPG